MISQQRIPKVVEDEAIQWLCTLNRSSLSQLEQDSFTQWLSSSAVNQAAYIKVEGLWERGESLQHLPKAATTQSSHSSNEWWRLLFSSPVWAVAYSCLMATTLFVFAYNYLPLNGSIQTYNLQTGIGEHSELQLDDGSHIEANTNSQLSVELTSDARTVQLSQGEAFFDVESDPERPFYVVTRQGRVRVLGTQFSVYQTELDTIVTVIEGKVTLSPKSSMANSSVNNIVLEKNERIDFTAVREGEEPEEIDATEALSWREQHLIFDGAPLPQVVTDLNRYFPETITLSQQQVDFDDIRITGIIMLSSDIDGVLSTLGTFNLESERSTSGDVITLSLKTSP